MLQWVPNLLNSALLLSKYSKAFSKQWVHTVGHCSHCQKLFQLHSKQLGLFSWVLFVSFLGSRKSPLAGPSARSHLFFLLHILQCNLLHMHCNVPLLFLGCPMSFGVFCRGQCCYRPAPDQLCVTLLCGLGAGCFISASSPLQVWPYSPLYNFFHPREDWRLIS